jgi:hypothetical protein
MLRKLLVLFFLCFLPRFSAAELYSNVLLNPGFELGTSDTNITSWERFGNAYRYSNATAHGESYAMEAWGNWWPTNPPDWNASGVYQDVPASRGQIWEASAWFNPITAPSGAAYAAVNISFHNAASQTIFIGTSADRVTSASPTGQWVQIKVRARATLNTAFVRVTPLFIQSPAFESNAIWFDDCALYTVPTNFIRFAGRDWIVLDQPSTPGENYYSTNCVRVDSNGWLHMEVKKLGNIWHCPSLEGVESLGFGEYRWYTGNALERIDSNLVVGLFTYAAESVFNTNQNEVDIEVSHAFPGTQTNCLLFTVQPYTIPGNSYQHPLETTNDLTTHRFIWRPDRVDWQSYYGHTPEPLDTNHFIAAWRFEGRGIPIETNEVPCMNLWLFYTNAPVYTQNVEMIIRGFSFTPFDGFLFTDDFDDSVMSNAWAVVGSTVRETNGCLIVEPDADTRIAGFATADPVHRNERGTEYVFSAQLHGITSAVAHSAENVSALMTLSAGTNVAGEAAAAFILQGWYDGGNDTMDFKFFTKTNSPGEEGVLRFDGLMTNVTGALSSGDLELRVGLDNVAYRVEVRDSQGRPANLATNSGSARGAHELGEHLCYGYWMVGAQNGGGLSGSAVTWTRTAIGVGGQAESFSLGSIETRGDAFSFSGAGFFDTRYTVEWTTNLMEDFTPLVTNAAVTGPFILFTGQQDSADSIFYRMKIE